MLFGNRARYEQVIIFIKTFVVPKGQINEGDLWIAPGQAMAVADFLAGVFSVEARNFFRERRNIVLPVLHSATFESRQSLQSWATFAQECVIRPYPSDLDAHAGLQVGDGPLGRFPRGKLGRHQGRLFRALPRR